VSVPFALRRPWLLVRDVFVDRDRPDFGRLRSLREPERFLWAILPHAARTFSACIALLPSREAKAAAVGYLYCRILDTYEDLHPDPRAREAALRAFAARFDETPPAPAPPIPDSEANDDRDAGHLLLVERCDLVDRVYADLSPDRQAIIRRLVHDMADGMCWSSRAFEEQGGVLNDETQLLRYCRNVLGHPVVFTMQMLTGGDLSPGFREDSMIVGEMVQLANVTRDIEKDLARGIAYHPSLRPLLGQDGHGDERVRAVREEFLRLALARAPAYRRMVENANLPRFSLARASAVLMLLFTDRYFRSCARRVGLEPWKGPRSAIALWGNAFAAFFSRRFSFRVLRRIEGHFSMASSST